MPTYDYECEACGHEFEVFQKMTDKPKRKCPECQGKVRKKIGTGAGLIFKGSGFYITDYRSDNYKKSAEADKPKSGSESKSADSSSPTKGADTKNSGTAPGSKGKGTSKARSKTDSK